MIEPGSSSYTGGNTFGSSIVGPGVDTPAVGLAVLLLGPRVVIDPRPAKLDEIAIGDMACTGNRPDRTLNTHDISWRRVASHETLDSKAYRIGIRQRTLPW